MFEPMAKKSIERSAKKSIERSQNLRQLPDIQKENLGGEVIIYNPDDSILFLAAQRYDFW